MAQPRYKLGPKIGLHTKTPPPPPQENPPSTDPNAPVDQSCDFVGIQTSSDGLTDVAKFTLYPLGPNVVPIAAVHLVVVPVADGGTSPIADNASADELMGLNVDGLIRQSWQAPTPPDQATAFSISVTGLPIAGMSDWRVVLEYAAA